MKANVITVIVTERPRGLFIATANGMFSRVAHERDAAVREAKKAALLAVAETLTLVDFDCVEFEVIDMTPNGSR